MSRPRRADAGIEGALPSEVAPVLRPQGLAAVHACLFDAQSMTREASWAISEDGRMQDASLDLGFAEAMATIVRVNPPGGRLATTRQLAPQRWAFGWRVDERRVVIAEVRFRTAREAPSDADMALVRMLCDARIRAIGHGPAVPDAAAALPAAAAADRPPQRADDERTTHDPRPAAPAGAPPAPQQGRRWALRGLSALAVAAGGLGYVQWRRSEAAAAEAQRLQALSDATLAQSIASALDRGDYGEVQVDLDRFEALRYFDAAMVVNARGQVVARSKRARSARIGEVLGEESAAGSRSIDLHNGAAPGLGRLYLWPYRSVP